MDRENKKQLEEFQYIIDNIPDPLAIIDMFSRFLFVSPSFEETTGYSSKKIIGKSIFSLSFFRKEHIPQILKNLKDRMMGKKVPIHDIEVYVKGGKKIIAQINGTTIKYRGKKAFLFSLRNVTEQRKLEGKLTQSEKRLSDIMLSSLDFIWESDSSGKFTYLSDKIENVLGYKPKELIGKKLFAIMSKKEASRLKSMFREAVLKKKKITDWENVNQHKNGKEIILLINAVPILDEKGKLLGYRGINKDITEKRKAEKEIEQAALIIDSSGDAIIGKDLKGKILSWNKGAEKLYGYKAKEVIGKNIKIIIPEDKQKEIPIILKDIQRGKSREDYETKRIKKNGEVIDVSLTVSPIKDGDEIIGASAIGRDITKIKEAERELKKSEKYYREIFELSPEAIVILDNKLNIFYSNNRIYDWLGYKKEEIIGQNALNLPYLTKKSKIIIKDKYLIHLNNPHKETIPYELEFVAKDGSDFIGRVYTKAIFDKKRKFYQDLVMISDITQDKKVEKERLEHQVEVEKMNNLMVGRELKMIELKEKIKKLEKNK